MPSNTTLHALQIRAFIDAAEDVEIDQDTVQDILEGFSGDDDSGGVAGLTGEEEEKASVMTEEDADSDSEGELDVSSLYTTDLDAQPTWTKQEIRYMMTHLKERGMSSWMKEYVVKRRLAIPELLKAFGINLCTELRQKCPKTMLYFLRVAMSRELRLREKLPHYNTISDAANLIRSSQRILILTGAGISVSCGIPDFRSRDGLYAMLQNGENCQFDDPQQMFDIHYFRENPSVFYSLASHIYPTKFTPSPCHRFIKLVEDNGKLLRNYTQNIDTLETVAGVRRVLQCHGSFATATCLQCRRRVPGKEIESDIFRQKVPLCSVCNPSEPPRPPQAKKGKRRSRKEAWDSDEEEESDESDYPPGIMKPDITFFGEKLTDEFDRSLLEDRNKVDLLLVIGTSLKVSPVADILSHLPHSVPQILINKTPIRHINPDIILLGDADDIVQYLCHRMEWELPPPPPPPTSTTRLHLPRGNLKKRVSSDILEHHEPRRIGESHVWLFQGAEGGKWAQELEKTYATTPAANETATIAGDITEREKIKRARFH